MSEYLALMEYIIREKIPEQKIKTYGDKNNKILENEFTPINDCQREY